MPTPSSRRPSKPKPERRDLSKFANGEEGYGGPNTGANDPKSQLEIARELKEFAKIISTITLDAVNTGAEVVKQENKHPLPRWITAAIVTVLIICVIVGIVVAVNYGNYFSKENQNAALTFVFQFPTAIVSFLAGRKMKGD